MNQPAQPARPAPPPQIYRDYPCLENARTVAILRVLRDHGPLGQAEIARRIGMPGRPLDSDRLPILREAGLARSIVPPGLRRIPWSHEITDLGRSALAALDAHERREGGR